MYTNLINNPIDKYSGKYLSQWMTGIPDELFDDAVGLWQIIPVLKDSFGLVGKELIECTRQSLLVLFAKGVEPVIAAQAGKYGWKLKDSYGRTPEEKAKSIIQEWLESKEDPVFWSSLWFTLPEYITEPSSYGVCLNEEPKLYPGKVHHLSEGGEAGIRVDNNYQEIMDFSNIPGYPPYLKIRAKE